MSCVWSFINRPSFGSVFRSLAFWDHIGPSTLTQSRTGTVLLLTILNTRSTGPSTQRYYCETSGLHFNISAKFENKQDIQYSGAVEFHPAGEKPEENKKWNLPLSHLWGCWRVSVAGQDLECDASITVSQQLLEFNWVATDLTAIHFVDYVPRVQHALPVNRASVQDSCNHHLSLLHTKSHPLKESKWFSIVHLHLINQRQGHFHGSLRFMWENLQMAKYFENWVAQFPQMVNKRERVKHLTA